MENKITPLHDRVVVLPHELNKETANGIVIPNTAKEKPMKGEVLAVGGGVNGETMTVKTNDIVLYGKYAGTDIEIDGVAYLIMRESDILAII